MKVLQSVAAPGHSTKYIDQVVRYAPENVQFIYFSWLKALFGRYDVFHVHWPEFLLRSSRRPVRIARTVLFTLLLWRLRLTRTAVVRTVHNLHPHEAGTRVETRLLACLDERTTWNVVLNPCSPVDRATPHTVILHGDYREQFASQPRAEVTPGRLTFFGRIEAYKGVLELIDVFEMAAEAGGSLHIVGRPTEAMRVALTRRRDQWSRTDASLDLTLEHVSDARMVHEITSAQAVVLPYREMHNSGVALVALSLDRPIIVPAGCVNEALSDEVGAGWVSQYEGDLTSETLSSSLRGAVPSAGARPNLIMRDWRTVGRAYAEVYRLAQAFSERSHSKEST